MKRPEQLPVEPLGQTGGETAIDTQIEVDLICGGVGFDDGLLEDCRWIREKSELLRSKGGVDFV